MIHFQLSKFWLCNERIEAIFILSVRRQPFLTIPVRILHPVAFFHPKNCVIKVLCEAVIAILGAGDAIRGRELMPYNSMNGCASVVISSVITCVNCVFL